MGFKMEAVGGYSCRGRGSNAASMHTANMMMRVPETMRLLPLNLLRLVLKDNGYLVAQALALKPKPQPQLSPFPPQRWRRQPPSSLVLGPIAKQQLGVFLVLEARESSGCRVAECI